MLLDQSLESDCFASINPTLKVSRPQCFFLGGGESSLFEGCYKSIEFLGRLIDLMEPNFLVGWYVSLR